MSDERSWLDWAGVGLLTACGALAALLEALLVPLYAGTVIVPVAVVLALASNAGLPLLARRLVPTTLAALLPFLSWLVVVVGFGLVSRPAGDVIFPGQPAAAQYVGYGVLLGGALVGTITVVASSPPPASRPRRPVSR